MNREVLPLLGAILIPILLVSLIFLYITKNPVILYLMSIRPIYYIIVIPFILGFIAALSWLSKMKKE